MSISHQTVSKSQKTTIKTHDHFEKETKLADMILNHLLENIKVKKWLLWEVIGWKIKEKEDEYEYYLEWIW